MTYIIAPYAIARLANFIIHDYAAMYFLLRKNHLATAAPELLFKEMQLLKDLPSEEQAIVLPVFERGFHYAHPEDLFLGMLADKDANIRREAVDKILTVRHSTVEASAGRGRGCK